MLLDWLKSKESLISKISDLRIIIENLDKRNDQLLDKLRDANLKMNILGAELETTDGIFSFPDGDYVETKVRPR